MAVVIHGQNGQGGVMSQCQYQTDLDQSEAWKSGIERVYTANSKSRSIGGGDDGVRQRSPNPSVS